MGSYHTVTAGECLHSIAHDHGFADASLIYDHPGNAELKARRPNLSVLRAGDEVYIPDPLVKSVERPTGARHRFVRTAQPRVLLRLYVDVHGEPQRNRPWKLEVDGETKTGRSGSDGLVEVEVPASAREAQLCFESDSVVYRLVIGGLDPLDEDSGVLHRLENLGYLPGGDPGEGADTLARALARFQGDSGLDVSGRLDEATKQRLREHHDFGRAS